MDPERKIMKLPYGHPDSRFFKPTDLGFEIAFVPDRSGASIPIRDEALHNGKRIVVALTKLLIVTALNNEALKQSPDFTEMPGDYLIYQDGKTLKVGFQTLRREIYKIP